MDVFPHLQTTVRVRTPGRPGPQTERERVAGGGVFLGSSGVVPPALLSMRLPRRLKKENAIYWNKYD